MDDQQIIDKAEAAADKIVDQLRGDLSEIDETIREPLLAAMHPGLVIAWVEGRQAGGEEVQDIVRNWTAQLRRELIRGLPKEPGDGD